MHDLPAMLNLPLSGGHLCETGGLVMCVIVLAEEWSGGKQSSA